TPMVFLGTRSIPKGKEQVNLWSHKQAEPVWAGTAGEAVRVVCFTNCERVELLLNGRSLGEKALADAEGHVLWWDVPYEPGVLTARGIEGDEIVSQNELRTSGLAARILATMDDV